MYATHKENLNNMYILGHKGRRFPIAWKVDNKASTHHIAEAKGMYVLVFHAFGGSG